jgi:hypothetical protein
VTFSFYNETLFNGYKANKSGDYSGEYYPAADVERLVEAAKRGYMKLKAYRGVCKGDTELITVIDLLKAALAALKGE